MELLPRDDPAAKARDEGFAASVNAGPTWIVTGADVAGTNRLLPE